MTAHTTPKSTYRVLVTGHVWPGDAMQVVMDRLRVWCYPIAGNQLTTRERVEVLLTCQALYLLDGWEKSTSARIDVPLAAALEMDFMYEAVENLAENR